MACTGKPEAATGPPDGRVRSSTAALPAAAVTRELSSPGLSARIAAPCTRAGYMLPSRYAIAYSGGLDSSVLVHAMVRWQQRTREADGTPLPAAPQNLRLLHVDHGLHEGSGEWTAHCRETAARLGLAYRSVALKLAPGPGQSVEAVAREARYQFFSCELAPGEALLSAHHGDDQAETLLLALLRGAGVAGLAAMPAVSTLGEGLHVRPLLSCSRAGLQAYAQQHGVNWIEDPSNENLRFDRNFLRARVMPQLRERWPGMLGTLGRSAQHLGDAAHALQVLGLQDLQTAPLSSPEPVTAPLARIAVEPLHHLSPGRACNALRAWIRSHNQPMPPAARLQQGLGDLLSAAVDAQPCLAWHDTEIRRYRGYLYLLPAQRALPGDLALALAPGQPLVLPEGLGTVLLAGPGPLRREIMSRADLQVRFRQGGERLRRPGDPYRRRLKSLLHESQVVPWMRARVPLLYGSNQLLAVADRWIAQSAACAPGESGVALHWHDHPALN